MPHLKPKVDEQTKYQYLIEQGWTYDPITGEVKNPKGKVKGANKNGWLYFAAKIVIDDESYWCQQYNHRFAYYFMTGECADIIDHVNRLRFDNQWHNIRSTDAMGNVINSAPRGKGYYIKDTDEGFSYVAIVRIDGKLIKIGEYPSAALAKAAYATAKIEIKRERNDA